MFEKKKKMRRFFSGKIVASLISICLLTAAIIFGCSYATDARTSTGSTGTTVNVDITNYSSDCASEVLGPYFILTPMSGLDIKTVFDGLEGYSQIITESNGKYKLLKNRPRYVVDNNTPAYGITTQFRAMRYQTMLMNPVQSFSSILFVSYSLWSVVYHIGI